jgi:sporadic carbohydrate cluster protein (TIGR04323 family)
MSPIKLITYSLPRSFYGMNIPLPIQSAYLRDYANRNGLQFSLPLTEICFHNSYHVLIKMLARHKEMNIHIGMSSILMLPHYDRNLLNFILNVRDNCFTKWYFPLENICLNSEDIKVWSDKFIKLQNISR